VFLPQTPKGAFGLQLSEVMVDAGSHIMGPDIPG